MKIKCFIASTGLVNISYSYFQEVIKSYNSSLRSCGNIFDSKQQLLVTASVLLNQHLYSLFSLIEVH